MDDREHLLEETSIDTLATIHRTDDEAEAVRPFSAAKESGVEYWGPLVLLSAITIMAGIGNNISFARMATVMYSITYAPWLLYATAIPYTAMYFTINCIKTTKAEQRVDLWRQYLLLACMIGFSGVFSQFSDPFVDVDLQGVLYVLVLPSTYLGIRIFLHPSPDAEEAITLMQTDSDSTMNSDSDHTAALDAFKRKTAKRGVLNWMYRHLSLVGSVVICVGVVIAPMQPLIDSKTKSMGTAFGIICFSLSQVLQAGVDVVQQHIFHHHHASLYPQLFYSNALTIPLYLLTPLLTMTPSLGGRSFDEAVGDQANATRCFANDSNVPYCDGTAWPWVIAFVVFYMSYFLLTARLVQKYDAIMQCVVISLVSPLTAITSMVPIFGGEHPSATLYLSLVVIFAGCVAYIIGDKQAHERRRNDRPREK